MQELRCASKKHGEAADDHTVIIKCDSRFCGAQPGIVVLHTFDLRVGEVVSTRKYRDTPDKEK